ncbi:hypothetical protein DAI22_10g077401 [Oryza sativa Japonica Group]|nr:hypothetical protein DAI22_10g077401 [Oryza sativa Japonica Group]
MHLLHRPAGGPGDSAGSGQPTEQTGSGQARCGRGRWRRRGERGHCRRRRPWPQISRQRPQLCGQWECVSVSPLIPFSLSICFLTTATGDAVGRRASRLVRAAAGGVVTELDRPSPFSRQGMCKRGGRRCW